MVVTSVDAHACVETEAIALCGESALLEGGVGVLLFLRGVVRSAEGLFRKYPYAAGLSTNGHSIRALVLGGSGGRPMGRGMTARAVLDVVERRAKAAGLPLTPNSAMSEGFH